MTNRLNHFLLPDTPDLGFGWTTKPIRTGDEREVFELPARPQIREDLAKTAAAVYRMDRYLRRDKWASILFLGDRPILAYGVSEYDHRSWIQLTGRRLPAPAVLRHLQGGHKFLVQLGQPGQRVQIPTLAGVAPSWEERRRKQDRIYKTLMDLRFPEGACDRRVHNARSRTRAAAMMFLGDDPDLAVLYLTRAVSDLLQSRRADIQVTN